MQTETPPVWHRSPLSLKEDTTAPKTASGDTRRRRVWFGWCRIRGIGFRILGD